MTDQVQFVIAEKNDIEGFLELQAQNLIANIPEEKHADGFVTTPLTVEQLNWLIENKCIFLGKKNGKVVAYVVSASWQFFAQWPIFEYMVSLFPIFNFKNDVMTDMNSYQYGPICISHECRGSGVFEGIFKFAKTEMAKRYPYGLTFINKKNARSFKAHSRLAEMEVIMEFAFGTQKYYMLGFPTA